MRLYFIFLIFLFTFSCANNNENLVDLDSFTKEGKKIELVKNDSLINRNIKKLNFIRINKHYNFSSWNDINYNSNNLIYPSKLNIEKKIKSKNDNYLKILSYKNYIIAIKKNSEIYLFDQDFKKIHSRKLYKRKVYKNYKINFELSVLDNKIFISDNLGNVHCINIDNFNIVWIKKLGVPFVSSIKAYKNNIYLINSNSKIYSLNIKSGKINWSFETSSKTLKHKDSYQLAIYKNFLYFTNDNAEIFCLDLNDSQIKWTLNFQLQNFQQRPLIFKSSPIVIDENGNLYVSTNYGYTYSFDHKNGAIIWSKPLKITNRFLIANNYLVMISDERLLILNKVNGSLLFNQKIDNFNKKKTKFKFNNILIGANNLYLFSENGSLVSLSLRKFENINVKKISKDHKDYIIGNNFLFVLSSNSIIKY